MRPIHERSRRRSRATGLIVILALAVLLALLLAACGSSSTTSSTSPTPGASGTAVKWTSADLASIQTDSSLKAMLPADIQSAGEIRVASDIPYAPWEMYDPPDSKNPAGFDYDLSQALGKKIGIKVTFNEAPFDTIILSIKGGKNDMIMSDMYDNADRQGQGVSFVDYALDGTSILVKKGNPNNISNLDSLAGKTVACEQGTTQQALLEKLNKTFAAAGKPAMTILTLPGQPAALLKVQGGTAVADVTDHSTAAYNAMNTNNGNTFEVLVDPTAPDGYEPAMVGIGIAVTGSFAKPELVTTVQKALQGLIDDGTYKKIVDSYGLLPVDSAMVNQGPAYAAQHATP
jgi:polar amino acid transport system substrate-binding protein